MWDVLQNNPRDGSDGNGYIYKLNNIGHILVVVEPW